MTSFAELVASRREWLDEVLKPWCRQACRRDLLLAEQEWTDLAGRPAVETTLWLWAWQRFPALVREGLQTIDETTPFLVECQHESALTGYADARASQQGELILITESGVTLPPISIDDIVKVTRAE